jgi:hypothetical protein
MNEIIKLLLDQGLLFPLQTIIIIIDAYLIVKEKSNGFVLLSVILVLSTFVLQLVRRRFLLLYPRNNWVGRESTSIDTFYLRIVIIISACSSLIGCFSVNCTTIESLDAFIESYLPWIIPITVGLIPGIFWFSSSAIDDRIAEKLKKYGPKISIVSCPCCEYPYAIQKKEVLHKNLGRVSFQCEHCKNDVTREITLNIGE